MENDVNKDLKVTLAQAYGILFMEGMAEDTTRGHITAKTADGTVYVKPWGMGFEEVGAEDLLGVDGDGKLRDGTGRLHSELILHLEIYRRRADVFSIAHVHPFHAVLLSAQFSGELHIVSQQGFHFGGGVPVYASPDMIRTRKQAGELAARLADGPVVLMKNHGFVTVGKTVTEAAILAIDFEKAAREHLAISLYERAAVMDREQVWEMNRKI
jgi:ribulose-5-phosphate 4-epimerase/fuculose-1-phosphate aldolase